MDNRTMISGILLILMGVGLLATTIAVGADIKYRNALTERICNILANIFICCVLAVIVLVPTVFGILMIIGGIK